MYDISAFRDKFMPGKWDVDINENLKCPYDWAWQLEISIITI